MTPSRAGLSRVLVVPGLLGLALSLQGCVAVAVGGAAATARTAVQERTMGDAMDDVATKLSIQRRMIAQSSKLYLKTDVSVVEGRVLITGLVPDQDARIEATKLAWQAPGVKEVINELEVSDRRNIAAWPHDTLITTRLRSRLIGDRDIKGVNYSIETKDDVVYLMGIAQSQDELSRVMDHAHEVKGVKRVVSYVKLKTDPTRNTALYSASAASSEPTGAIAPPPSYRASPSAESPLPPPAPAPGATAGHYGNYDKNAPAAVAAPQGYADYSDKYDRPATGSPTNIRTLPPISAPPKDVESLSAPPVR